MAATLAPSGFRQGLFRPLLLGLGMLPLGGLALGCSEKGEATGDGSNVDQVVYAVRQHTTGEGENLTIDVAGGMGQVMDYKRYNPGGRLEVLNLRNGNIQNIIAGLETADIASVDVSYDATKVVFSMKKDSSDSYHVYVANIHPSAEGDFGIRQLTFGPYDDIHAIWLPGERIAFVTDQGYTEMGTRADEYNHARIVTQVATITLEGGDADRKLCSQNLSHTINLFSMHDGRVGFSRWEHLENVNDVKLFSMNPDCTQMTAIAGQHGKPANSLVQISETNEPNVFLAVATSRENTIQAGALAQIDARGQGSHANEETADIEVLTPSVPRGEELSPAGRYRSPTTLPDGRILVSWADGTVNEQNEANQSPPDYGVFLYDADRRQNQLVINHDDSWELYARPVVIRDEPEVIPSIQNSQDSTRPTTLGSADIAQTSLASVHGETVSGAQFDGTDMDIALREAVKVRVIEGFSSEAAPGVTMFGLTMAEGAALLGEAPVREDGSWAAEIPPFIPVHLQAVDEFDLAIRNQTTWIQGMPGESRQCGGCHESRTEPFNIAGQQLPIAAADPEDFMVPVMERTEYPWKGYADGVGSVNEIQAILNARCVSCHNETENGTGIAQTFYSISMSVDGEATTFDVPRFDMTDRTLTVAYDGEVRDWPASYVSIFYPAAMQMEMADMDVTGEIPPMWAVPSDARNSAMLEKLNVTSSLDSTRYAWALGESFSDPGIAGGVRTDHAEVAGLTREELVKLIRVIDFGGQYYARQNTGFVPFNDDPLGGTNY